MNTQFADKLFTLFSNLRFKDNINQNGIGLGLKICKKIVNALKGKINCCSQVGKGTLV